MGCCCGIRRWLLRERMFVSVWLGLVVLACPVVLVAEDFDAVDWFERRIGDGVVWRQYEFDSLFGARQCVTFIEADLQNLNVVVQIPYLASGLQRISTMIPSQVPAALGGVNGTYFSTTVSPSGHNTYLRIDGAVIPHLPRSKGAWGHHAALARNTSGMWEIIPMPDTSAQWDDNTTHPTIVANGPWLVRDGVPDTASMALPSGTHCTGRHPRTAVGITADNRLILLTVDGRTDRSTGATCAETAQILLWLGVVDALNMDGGGSTTMYVKNEPHNGVVNYPSDGGGERSTANAVAVVSTPAGPAPWDARLLDMTFTEVVDPEQTQTVTLTYRNIGSGTWTRDGTRLVTSRPTERSSALYEDAWVAPWQPALMTPATVAPGSDATFRFPVTAPATTTVLSFLEYFMLVQESVGRIGPSDARARLKLTVIPQTPTGDSFLVETRLGGLNYLWYSDHPSFADSSASCTAAGTTPGIGSRWTSSYTSVVGVRDARWRPDFPRSGQYHVSIAWPEGSNRRKPILYHVDHDEGRTSFEIDQTAPGNTWYPLGTFSFTAGQSDGGRVIMTNAITDQSGNMWAGPVRFMFLGTDADHLDLY